MRTVALHTWKERKKEMYIGSIYRLCDQETRTMLGYKSIVIKERVLVRTETKLRESLRFTSYHYALMCLVNSTGYQGSGDSAEIPEEQLQEEVTSGFYEFNGWWDGNKMHEKLWR